MLTLTYHQSGKHGWPSNGCLFLLHWPESSPVDPVWCTGNVHRLNAAIDEQM